MDIGAPMKSTIRIESKDVEARLGELGLSRPELLEVLQVAFAEHGNCTENDPAGAKGYAVYKHGVRGLREQYRMQGWEIDRTGGLETIVHRERKIRIAVINTDSGTSDAGRIPQNRNRKGPNSERAALTNAQLLPGVAEWPLVSRDGVAGVVADEFATWHLCIHIDGDNLLSELSLLHEFVGGYFQAAHERIFVVRPGDWNLIGSADTSPETSGPELEIEVRRKKL